MTTYRTQPCTANPPVEAPFPAFSGAAKQMGCASRACARDRKFVFGENCKVTPPPVRPNVNYFYGVGLQICEANAHVGFTHSELGNPFSLRFTLSQLSEPGFTRLTGLSETTLQVCLHILKILKSCKSWFKTINNQNTTLPIGETL
jgi:hypothetical protein